MSQGPTLSPLAARAEAAGLWNPGARVLAACSAGPDSLALLSTLDELRRAGRLDLVSAHVHHGLRGPEADEDARHAAEIAARLGVPHLERRRDAAAERAARRRGLEEAARQVRREALEEMREESGCDVIALAHTADDQAETMLLWLLRGAGPDGLSGMPARQGRFVRPLLSVRREDLRQALLAAGLAWRSDATNWAPSSARSLVREALDRLSICFNERLVERMGETAALVRDDASLVEAAVDAAAAGRLAAWEGAEGPGPGARLLVGRGFEALPPVVGRRLVRRFLRAARPGLPPPSLDATRRVLALATARGGPCRAVHVAGVIVRRVGDHLVAGGETPWQAPEMPVPLPVPGRLAWGPDGSLVTELVEGAASGSLVAAELAARESPPAAPTADAASGAKARPARLQALLDADRLGCNLVVRARRPGDVVFLPGSKLPRRTGEALAALGVPAGLRDRHPLVCQEADSSPVVWVVGHAPNPAHGITRQTTRVLRLTWQPRVRAPEGPGGSSS